VSGNKHLKTDFLRVCVCLGLAIDLIQGAVHVRDTSYNGWPMHSEMSAIDFDFRVGEDLRFHAVHILVSSFQLQLITWSYLTELVSFYANTRKKSIDIVYW